MKKKTPFISKLPIEQMNPVTTTDNIKMTKSEDGLLFTEEMKNETIPLSFRLDFGKNIDGDVFAHDCKFTLGNELFEGEKEIVATPKQVKNGLHFKILKSHQENGVTCIDKVKLLSVSVVQPLAMPK